MLSSAMVGASMVICEAFVVMRCSVILVDAFLQKRDRGRTVQTIFTTAGIEITRLHATFGAPSSDTQRHVSQKLIVRVVGRHRQRLPFSQSRVVSVSTYKSIGASATKISLPLDLARTRRRTAEDAFVVNGPRLVAGVAQLQHKREEQRRKNNEIEALRKRG